MSEFDSPWKEALEVYFPLFLAFFFPQAHPDIDWSRGYESLEKELQQVVREAEVGARVVDKLFKVWLKDGREEWVLVHVEVQSQRLAEFPERMYVYNYRLFDRYNRKVASLAVLADESRGWRPDSFGYSLWGCEVSLRWPTVKLLDYEPQVEALEANPNPFAALVVAHLMAQRTGKDPEQRRYWKTRLIRSLYARGLSAADVRQLFRLIDWMMALSPAMEEQLWSELQQYEEERRMPYVTTVERRALEKGREQGQLEGFAVALEVKFGAAGLNLLPELRQIHDTERLRAFGEAIKTAATVDELRQLLT